MEELFDYAPHLIKVENLQREIHDLLLQKKYEQSIPKLNELVVEARLAKAWVNHQLEQS